MAAAAAVVAAVAMVVMVAMAAMVGWWQEGEVQWRSGAVAAVLTAAAVSVYLGRDRCLDVRRRGEELGHPRTNRDR